MTKKTKYLVIIGDIVSSRAVEDRKALQETLLQAINAVGSIQHPEPDPPANQIISPYTVTLGDEFQAVYGAADTIFRDALYILEKVYPLKVRFSFGIGSIATSINHDQAIGMDGKAFYNARDGINWIKNEGEEYIFHISGLEDPFSHDLSNNTLHLISNLISDWNLNRIKVLRLRLNGLKVKEIHKKINISKTAVYKNIHAGYIKEIINSFSVITRTINHSLGES